jgi:hypothetical protein
MRQGSTILPPTDKHQSQVILRHGILGIGVYGLLEVDQRPFHIPTLIHPGADHPVQPLAEGRVG